VRRLIQSRSLKPGFYKKPGFFFPRNKNAGRAEPGRR
jgi:hypothetical protein